jgi:hypothetical protein
VIFGVIAPACSELTYNAAKTTIICIIISSILNMSSGESSPTTLKSHSAFDSTNEKKDAEVADIEEIGLEESVFDDPNLAQFYKPREDYEGYQRFDPKAVWTAKEEQVIVRKIDIRIMFWCCIMFVALQLDRGNICM